MSKRIKNIFDFIPGRSEGGFGDFMILTFTQMETFPKTTCVRGDFWIKENVQGEKVSKRGVWPMRRQYRLYAEHDYARLKKQATSYKLVKVATQPIAVIVVIVHV